MIGKRLEDARESKGYSRKEVAKHLNIHESTYGKYELGHRKPDAETILALANFYGVSVDLLLGREVEPAAKEDDGLTDKGRVLIEIAKNLDDSGKDVLIAAGRALIDGQAK